MSLVYEPRHILHEFHSDSVNCLRFSADGQFLASGGSDGRIVICKPHTGTLVATLERGNGVILCVEWTDKRHEQLVAGDSSGYMITIKAADVVCYPYSL